MDRQRARELVAKYAHKDVTVRHLISVEGVMRALARRFGEDEDRWGLTGIFHDLDYDALEKDLSRHTDQTVEWLRAEGYSDEQVLNAIRAHLHEPLRTDLLSKAIVHADAVAGLLVACALVRPEKTDGMKVSSVKKKLKDKSFAPGVDRAEIRDVEGAIGLPLDEFISVSISGLQEVAPEIGLG